VTLTVSGNAARAPAIALTNVASTPLLRGGRGEGARRQHSRQERDRQGGAEAAMSICDPVADTRGPKEYRRLVLGVMVRRAIERAKSRAR
jgi:carbon-monoxide dehydrogenase medium subunit